MSKLINLLTESKNYAYEYRDGKHGIVDLRTGMWRDTQFSTERRARAWIDEKNGEHNLGESSDPELDAAPSYERQTILNDRRKAEFVAKLSDQAPEGSDLQVGDWVHWTNDFGIIWEHQVLGFQYGDEFGDKYDKHVILDTDSYWSPHAHGECTKVDGPTATDNGYIGVDDVVRKEAEANNLYGCG